MKKKTILADRTSNVQSGGMITETYVLNIYTCDVYVPYSQLSNGTQKQVIATGIRKIP